MMVNLQDGNLDYVKVRFTKKDKYKTSRWDDVGERTGAELKESSIDDIINGSVYHIYSMSYII